MQAKSTRVRIWGCVCASVVLYGPSWLDSIDRFPSCRTRYYFLLIYCAAKTYTLSKQESKHFIPHQKKITI